MADELRDPRPGDVARVQQADPAMREVVRAPERDPSGPAGFRDRRPDRVGARLGEQARLGVTEATMRKRCFDRLGEHRVELDPQRSTGLRRRGSKAHALARLVVVADQCVVDARDTSARPVEPEQREPMLGRDAPEDGLHVGRAWRVDLLQLLARQLDRAIAGERRRRARPAGRAARAARRRRVVDVDSPVRNRTPVWVARLRSSTKRAMNSTLIETATNKRPRRAAVAPPATVEKTPQSVNYAVCR